MDRKELIDLMCKSQLTNQQFMDIYDEMRSRTCENCKYYDGSHKCNNENSIAYGTNNRVYTYDGCKEDWESR